MIGLARLAAAVAATAALPVLAQSSQSAARPEPQPMSQQDKEFVSYAAEDNQAEIALCLLAETKAESPAIKAFARLMVDDHTEIESRLAAVANAEKSGLPEGIGDEGKKTHDKLEPLNGREFEREFMQAQIEDHANDLKRFDHQASTTKNEAIRQFASETGPLLEQHLALAKAVRTSGEGK